MSTDLGWLASHYPALGLVTYEGGQHLEGVGTNASDPAMNALFDAANRDPRMGELLLDYLQELEGPRRAVHFKSNVAAATGGAGALEYQDQPHGESFKYQALEQFVASQPCWWNGCATLPAEIFNDPSRPAASPAGAIAAARESDSRAPRLGVSALLRLPPCFSHHHLGERGDVAELGADVAQQGETVGAHRRVRVHHQDVDEEAVEDAGEVSDARERRLQSPRPRSASRPGGELRPGDVQIALGAFGQPLGRERRALRSLDDVGDPLGRQHHLDMNPGRSRDDGAPRRAAAGRGGLATRP